MSNLIALIYKYGGWYSDLDMVFIRPINHLKNVLGSDYFHQSEISEMKNGYLGKQVSNAIFHFDAKSKFMESCLNLFPKVFNGDWGSGGPTLFQIVLNQMCGLSKDSRGMYLKTYNPENCQGIKVVPPR